MNTVLKCYAITLQNFLHVIDTIHSEKRQEKASISLATQENHTNIILLFLPFILVQSIVFLNYPLMLLDLLLDFSSEIGESLV